MGAPAAKQGDLVTSSDNHMIQPPGPTSPVLVPHLFLGTLDGNLSSNVNILGRPAAFVGSTATNNPPHIPIGGTFVNPPRNRAQIVRGSATVFINKKSAARSGDHATTCHDPADLPSGSVQAVGTVTIGG